MIKQREQSFSAPLRFRDPVNGFLHLAALILSLVGTVALVWVARESSLKLLATAIYGVGMCGCFLGSSLHHLISGDRALEHRLLRLDHAAIYPFIAGTYTPICLFLLPGRAGYLMLAAAWALALAGIVYKLGFAPDPEDVNDPPGLVDTLFYVAMGWLVLLQGGEVLKHSAGNTVWLAVAGGALYTLGGLILSRRLCDFWPGRFGHHEIWHVCVMGGAACFYGYIFLNLT